MMNALVTDATQISGIETTPALDLGLTESIFDPHFLVPASHSEGLAPTTEGELDPRPLPSLLIDPRPIPGGGLPGVAEQEPPPEGEVSWPPPGVVDPRPVLPIGAVPPSQPQLEYKVLDVSVLQGRQSTNLALATVTPPVIDPRPESMNEPVMGASPEYHKLVPKNVGFFDYGQYVRYQGGAIADIPTDAIDGLLLAQLFDETYYLNRNADVAAAVQSGAFASGYQHFLTTGLSEGRDPSILYSEAYYLANNQDVSQAIQAGDYKSGLEHFLTIGHEEVRDPSTFFDQSDYLLLNQDVADAVQAGTYQSAFEHYIYHGANEVGRLSTAAAAYAGALFNEAFYLAGNPAIASDVSQGLYADGFSHFIQIGQFSNLDPSAGLDLEALAATPEVQSGVNSGQFASSFDYYIEVGRF